MSRFETLVHLDRRLLRPVLLLLLSLGFFFSRAVLFPLIEILNQFLSQLLQLQHARKRHVSNERPCFTALFVGMLHCREVIL